MIPYGRQNINQSDIDAVVKVLKSDFLTQGPMVPKFEKSIAGYCGCHHAISVNSATSALHIACMALGVGKDDIVWTTPISFVASANCAIYCGASVDFVDIDPFTYNLSIENLEKKLEAAKQSNRLPKVVIPVHLSGLPCDMEGIYFLSKRYGFKIIEDASHAIGSRYKGEPVGLCKFSDITVFSFHPVKIINTGEGGMALTNDPQLANLMTRLRSHGITRDPLEMTVPSDGPWYYQQLELGFNYRMTELQAALGLSQLERLDEFVLARQKIALQYNKLLEDVGVVTPCYPKDDYSSFHLYIIRLPQFKGQPNHREVFERLRSHGVGVNLHYIPIYRHPFYSSMGFNSADFPESERYYQEAISLPIYPGLTMEQQVDIVTRLVTPIGHQTIF